MKFVFNHPLWDSEREFDESHGNNLLKREETNPSGIVLVRIIEGSEEKKQSSDAVDIAANSGDTKKQTRSKSGGTSKGSKSRKSPKTS